MPCGVCLAKLEHSREELCSIGERGVGMCFWYQVFSFIFVWAPLQACHKPQAIASIAKPAQKYFRATDQVVGIVYVLVRVLDRIPEDNNKQHGNADALSRLPLPMQPSRVPVAEELVLLVKHLNDSPVTVSQVQSTTQRIPHCHKSYSLFVRDGQRPARRKP